MWPWTHLVFGYVLYYLFRRLNGATEPADRMALIWLIIGTQFPDLIDKPFAWTIAILPNGRSLAHSVFTATIVTGFLIAYTKRRGYPSRGYGFGVGYVSHLIGDGVGPLLNENLDGLAYLLWPVLPPIDYETPPTFAAHFAMVEFSPLLGIKLAVAAVVFIAVARRWLVSRNTDVEK